MNMQGKVAIVTGAASGIGKSIAQLYAEAGASVILSDIDEESGRRVAEEVGGANGRTVFVAANVADPADCERTVDVTLERYGRLDYACNNAGIGGEENPTADDSIAG